MTDLQDGMPKAVVHASFMQLPCPDILLVAILYQALIRDCPNERASKIRQYSYLSQNEKFLCYYALTKHSNIY